MIPALLIIFMPRPSIAGVQFILFPIIGLVALFIVLSFGKLNHRVPSRDQFLFVLYALLFLTVTQLFTLSIRASDIRPTGIIEPMRPLLLCILFVAGAYVGRFPAGAVMRALFFIGVLILVGQAAVCVLQVAGIRALDFIYNTDKLSSHTGRILGTLKFPKFFPYDY